MGKHTKIEWADSTLNLQMGCDGCELWNPAAGVKRCYAGNLTVLHGGPGKKGWPTAFEQPRIFPERLQEALKWSDLAGKDRPDKPWLNGSPRLIFLNDMGDTFTESLPIDWLDDFIVPLAESRHIYIILTKRPRRMYDYFYAHCSKDNLIPENFWLLTSVTGPENVGRIRELLKLRALGARVLGVSYEPAWGAVDFTRIPIPESHGVLRAINGAGELDVLRGEQITNIGVGYASPKLGWLIAGGESGAGAKPSHPNWFRAARDACQAVGVAYFFKQWGEWTPHTAKRSTPMRVLDGGTKVWRAGKQRAGAILDGREWREMPDANAEGQPLEEMARDIEEARR
jgi:protein gp37